MCNTVKIEEELLASIKKFFYARKKKDKKYTLIELERDLLWVAADAMEEIGEEQEGGAEDE